MRGIETAGVYVPAYRLSMEEVGAAWGNAAARGVEAKAVAAADEDAVTMAVAAVEDALARSSVSAEEVGFVGLATTTPPLGEEMLVPRVVRMLGLGAGVRTAAATQSTLAGAEVLDHALGVDEPAVVVAADAPRGDPAGPDHALGAGAAAFVVTDDPAVAVRAGSWRVDEAPGIRYRTADGTGVRGLGITAYERGVIRDSLVGAVEGLGDLPEPVVGAALYQPDAGIPYRVTRALPFDAEVTARGVVADRIGDAGAAGVPIGLVAALCRAGAGDHTVAGFYGSGGGAAVFLLEGGLDQPDPIGEGERVSYAAYLRKRGYVVDGEVAGGGAHVSLPAWRQSLDQRYRLVAGACPECGGVAFPPSGACPECHALVAYEPVVMPREGRVAAVTTIGRGGAPPEFAAFQEREGAFRVAIVSLEHDRGMVRLPAQLVGPDADDVGVGDPVRAVVRRVYEQEGLPRYGVKFAPA